ncbi:MAG: hypothetical protein EOO96_01940 [Pedobacter sp.]|nr:MAG: hypothetical protein EOO96_01940 [Pedobacter sp.]
MATLRNTGAYQTLVYDFTNEVYVVCPNCEKKAIVKAVKLYDENVKLICPNCGYNKMPDKNFIGLYNSKKTKIQISGVVVISAGIDPYFYLPLWLKTTIGENTLWAYNYEHLNFIKDFVRAKLRERNIDDIRNKSLGSRLPKWLTSHKNRELVLKAIDRLKAK